jgi:hypothetical protein
MSTEDKLYPFLISRSDSYDYKVIVAPGFLVDNNLSDHLIQAAPNEKPTETGIILHRYVDFGFNNSNNFTLLYRIDIATKKDIGENSEEKLRDNNGRYINLIEGVIYQGVISEEDSRDLISHEYFQEIRRNFANDYKEFWHNKNSQTSISNTIPCPFPVGWVKRQRNLTHLLGFMLQPNLQIKAFSNLDKVLSNSNKLSTNQNSSQNTGVADFGYNLYLLAISKLLHDQYFRLLGLLLLGFPFDTLIQQRQNTFKVQNLPTYHPNTIDIVPIIVFGMLVTIGIAYLGSSFFLTPKIK